VPLIEAPPWAICTTTWTDPHWAVAVVLPNVAGAAQMAVPDRDTDTLPDPSALATITTSSVESRVSVIVAVAVVSLARPLVFASIDQAVAGARGVPVRMLDFTFLALVGITAAEATRVVGALLLLGLLAAPAGAAQRLTSRPFAAMWLSAAIAVLSIWAGLAIAYAAPKIPPSFAIVAFATSCYLTAILATAVRGRERPLMPQPINPSP